MIRYPELLLHVREAIAALGPGVSHKRCQWCESTSKNHFLNCIYERLCAYEANLRTRYEKKTT